MSARPDYRTVQGSAWLGTLTALAARDGVCPASGREVREGDLLRFMSGEWVHIDALHNIEETEDE